MGWPGVQPYMSIHYAPRILTILYTVPEIQVPEIQSSELEEKIRKIRKSGTSIKNQRYQDDKPPRTTSPFPPRIYMQAVLSSRKDIHIFISPYVSIFWATIR